MFLGCQCEFSGDKENLWLNLSDGSIGGGRKNWDGSGGSNGALNHFMETGEKYPLVGTYSYSSFHHHRRHRRLVLVEKKSMVED